MARLAAVMLAIASAVTRVSAAGAPVGTTNITCSDSYGWANNSLGQSPCLVVAQLIATNEGDDFKLTPLDSGGEFINAEPAPWTCNVPFYSLFAACGDCQGDNYIPWKNWTEGCNGTTYETYQGVAIPSDTQIPGWADLDVTKEGIYDPGAAKQYALAVGAASSSISAAAASSSSAAAASASASLSSVSVASVSSASVASASSTFAAAHPTTTSATADPDQGSTPTTAPVATSGKKSSNAGAIAGGVVGGLVVLALLALGAFWLRRRSAAATPTAAAEPDVPRPMSEHYMTPVASPRPQQQQQQLYDPANPATFPAPMRVHENPFQSPSPSTGGYSHGPRGYTGAPEV